MSNLNSSINLKINIPFLNRVSLNQIAIFSKQMAIMMASGVNIIEALSIARDSSTGKFSDVIGKVIASVEAGRPLADSLQVHQDTFSNLYISTVKIGESSGNLPESLTNLSEQLEKQRELTAKVKGVLMYPAIILTAIIGVGIFVFYFILPKILPLFRQLDVELPLTTIILIWIATLVENHGILLLIGFILVIIATPLVLKWKKLNPITHWLMLNTPGLKTFVKSITLASFCRTMGILLKSGINIDQALEITGNSLNNHYYTKALIEVEQNVIKGASLGPTLTIHDNLFPKLVTQMISIGEESGNLDEAFTYLSEYYEKEVDNAAKTLPSLIEPVLLLVIGMMVGFLALSILSPIFKITGSVRR